eukprot:6472977-Amphidinium_carterae.1
MPDDNPRKYKPIIKPDDKTAIGCNRVIHPDASQTPLFKPSERALHIVPRGTYHQNPAGHFDCLWLKPMT